jgi:hypothetical protein
MATKKQSRGECPWRDFKPCKPSCVFYRSGLRIRERTGEKFAVEDCAINIIADNVEMLHSKVLATQKEMGTVKNIVAFAALSMIGVKNKEGDLLRIIDKATQGTSSPQEIEHKG